MTPERLRIWCNWPLSPELEARLREGVGPHELIHRPGAEGPDAELQAAHIAFGRPAVESLLLSQSLRWVQVASAGYTPWDREDLWSHLRARGAAFTRSSAVYSEPCAEHVLAFMLAWARRLPWAWQDQAGPRSWPYREVRTHSRLLVGQRGVIFGLGSIGARLVQLLAPFAMTLIGVRDRISGDEPIPTFTLDDPALPAELAQADHVINLLPLAASTERAFDRTRLQAIRKGAVFYNVGRGGTVDQGALLALIESDHFSAVLLDVVEPEPLPADHPLWRAKNCFITPHSAGGHHDEHARLVEHFLQNLGRFARGESLLDRVI